MFGFFKTEIDWHESFYIWQSGEKWILCIILEASNCWISLEVNSLIGGSSKCSPFSEYWRKDSSEIKMSVGKYRLALHECAERNEVQYIWLAYFQPITSTDHASAVIFRGDQSAACYSLVLQMVPCPGNRDALQCVLDLHKWETVLSRRGGCILHGVVFEPSIIIFGQLVVFFSVSENWNINVVEWAG